MEQNKDKYTEKEIREISENFFNMIWGVKKEDPERNTASMIDDAPLVVDMHTNNLCYILLQMIDKSRKCKNLGETVTLINETIEIIYEKAFLPNRQKELEYIREMIENLTVLYKDSVFLMPLLDLYNEIGLMQQGLWEESK